MYREAIPPEGRFRPKEVLPKGGYCSRLMCVAADAVRPRNMGNNQAGNKFPA